MLLQLVLAWNIHTIALERWWQDSFLACHRKDLDISQRSADVQVVLLKDLHHGIPEPASPVYADLDIAWPLEQCTCHLCTCHLQNPQKWQLYCTCCTQKSVWSIWSGENLQALSDVQPWMEMENAVILALRKFQSVDPNVQLLHGLLAAPPLHLEGVGHGSKGFSSISKQWAAEEF